MRNVVEVDFKAMRRRDDAWARVDPKGAAMREDEATAMDRQRRLDTMQTAEWQRVEWHARMAMLVMRMVGVVAVLAGLGAVWFLSLAWWVGP